MRWKGCRDAVHATQNESCKQRKHLKIIVYTAKGQEGKRQIYNCYKVLFIVLHRLSYLNIKANFTSSWINSLNTNDDFRHVTL